MSSFTQSTMPAHSILACSGTQCAQYLHEAHVHSLAVIEKPNFKTLLCISLAFVVFSIRKIWYCKPWHLWKVSHIKMFK